MPDPEFIRRLREAAAQEVDNSYLYYCRRCGRDLQPGGERRLRVCHSCILEAKNRPRIIGRVRYGFKKALR